MKAAQRFVHKQTIILVAIALLASFISFSVVKAISVNNSHKNTSSVPACKDTCVSLYEDKASPNTIAVAVGSYVQFNSKDGKTHDLSLGAGGEEHQHMGKFQSGEFKADEGWRVQFKNEGTFTFHDHYNPKVNIVVIVYTPGKDYKVQ